MINCVRRICLQVALVCVGACNRPLLQAPAANNQNPGQAAGTPSAQKLPTETAAKIDAPMPPGAARMTEATTLYDQRCALCHGAKGHGDGVAAANLRPQPRSFASDKWQQETSDAAIMEIIVKGGAAVGRSMMMPPAKDLAGQTELLHALAAVVRNFGPGGAKAATP